MPVNWRSKRAPLSGGNTRICFRFSRLLPGSYLLFKIGAILKVTVETLCAADLNMFFSARLRTTVIQITSCGESRKHVTPEKVTVLRVESIA